MPKLPRLKQTSRLTNDSINDDGDVFQTPAFMEAIVAGYALVAHADGEVTRTERRRLMFIALTEPRLAYFSQEEIAEEFANHESNFDLDVEVAIEIAYEKVCLMKNRPRGAQAVVEACRLAIVADSTLHPSEFSEINRIAGLLDLNVSNSLSHPTIEVPFYNIR